jgi:hypothetical protein
MAVITCGRNSAPYSVLDRSYCWCPVRMELTAGKVTSTIPCTRPAAYTARDSARLATLAPLSSAES